MPPQAETSPHGQAIAIQASRMPTCKQFGIPPRTGTRKLTSTNRGFLPCRCKARGGKPPIKSNQGIAEALARGNPGGLHLQAHGKYNHPEDKTQGNVGEKLWPGPLDILFSAVPGWRRSREVSELDRAGLGFRPELQRP